MTADTDPAAKPVEALTEGEAEGELRRLAEASTFAPPRMAAATALPSTLGRVNQLKNDFPAGVLTGEAVNEVFALAKAEKSHAGRFQKALDGLEKL